MLALTLALSLTTASDPPTVTASSDAPTLSAERPLTSMSRAQLKREYARIEEVRPGLGGPITMMAIGGGLIVYGSVFLLASSGGPSGLFSNGSPLGYLFVAMLMAGAGLLVPGIWLIWNRKDERAELGQRMDEITARLEELERVDPRRRGRRSDDDDTRRERLYQPPPPREGSELPPQL